MTTFRIDGDRISGLFRRGDRGDAGSRCRRIRRGGAGRSSPRAAPSPRRRRGRQQLGAGCRATAREITAPGKPRTVVVAAPGRPARKHR